jgi:tetratricopeptide (TPR) repeat protein
LLYENGQYRQALDEYEQTAWSRGAHSRAVDAALGGLHANEKMLQHADAAEQAKITARATALVLRFVSSYPEHPAAPGILAQAGTTLLEQHQYDRALSISENIVIDAAPALRQVAWSLRAQVFFATEDYAAAAASYGEALQLASKDDMRRAALQKGLAMATYQQAEQVFTLGDKQGAANLYQQAADITPDADLRSKSTYDVATTLLALESWPEAISMLEQFREDYPDDPLQKDVSPKLAYAYERNGDISRAADEFLFLGQDERQTDTLQREALLRAAELYLQVDEVPQGIIASERYIERFPQPPGIAVGVMQQLSDIESSLGKAPRSQYWLEEIIRLDRMAGSSRTHLPAAESALELAEYRLAAFRRIQLVNPVQDNLAQKIASMKQALQAFETAIDYGIAPVTTAATYHIANMYDELGRALLSSERPASLTKEELVEYDLLLAEQAEPFEQKAIDIYTINAQRSGDILQDPWVEKSAQQLVELQDGR